MAMVPKNARGNVQKFIKNNSNLKAGKNISKKMPSK